MALKLAIDGVYFLVFLFVGSCSLQVHGQGNIFEVSNYGDPADAEYDYSKAILMAWNASCQGRARSKIVINPGTYLMKHVTFAGPCNNYMVLEVEGTLKAPPGPSTGADNWIAFHGVSGLTVTGRGTFDGQGVSAWPYNHCRNPQTCQPLPHSIKFNGVSNARIEGITLSNSKGVHTVIDGSAGMTFTNIKISSPGDSPNTDGIHIGNSNNINVTNSIIATGDDCISLGSGSTDIRISGISCGPGHGISIGSLGKYPNEADVHGITVTNCTLSQTQNGLRIKTIAPSPPSKVFDVTFQNIVFNNVQNPVIIDQHYCPSKTCGEMDGSKVAISNVKLLNIKGSSSTITAVNLQCSSSVPCQGIVLSGINIKNYGDWKIRTKSSCSNAHGIASGPMYPPSCL